MFSHPYHLSHPLMYIEQPSTSLILHDISYVRPQQILMKLGNVKSIFQLLFRIFLLWFYFTTLSLHSPYYFSRYLSPFFSIQPCFSPYISLSQSPFSLSFSPCPSQFIRTSPFPLSPKTHFHSNFPYVTLLGVMSYSSCKYFWNLSP